MDKYSKQFPTWTVEDSTYR